MTYRLQTTRLTTCKNSLLILLLLFFSIPAWAQDKIESDRPTESLTAKTVGKHVFQVESGLRKEGINASDYSLKRPMVDWRFGLFEQLELRLNTTAETQRLYTENKLADGLLPVEIGAKAVLLKTKDTSFLLSAYGQVSLPQLAAKEHRPEKTFYRARLLLDNRWGSLFGLQTNVGRDWSESDGEQVWVYAVAPHVDLSSHWQLFVESHGYIKKGSEPEHYINGGAAYYISPNVEIDVDAGKGLNTASSDYFITAGISFRLK